MFVPSNRIFFITSREKMTSGINLLTCSLRNVDSFSLFLIGYFSYLAICSRKSAWRGFSTFTLMSPPFTQTLHIVSLQEFLSFSHRHAINHDLRVFIIRPKDCLQSCRTHTGHFQFSGHANLTTCQPICALLPICAMRICI